MTEPNYRSLPALAAYIDRIGAEELNFRRFMVKEQKGPYYVERTMIRISSAGDVTCSRKEHAPTAEEAAAIKEAVLREKWPRCVLASMAEAARQAERLGGVCHLFWDVARTGIVMIQQRLELETGKAYVPWTFFSDAAWRRMEPDGALPFWKSQRPAAGRRVMVHEGAKSAEACDALTRDPAALAAHPWGEEIAEHVHWGMIGGALAPHRADYDELREARPLSVTYVCDNDWEGHAALQEVSRHYGGRLKGIRFDRRWPASWDMADEMPREMFRSGRWLGPRLAELTLPATHATELVSSGKGRPTAVLRRAFREEWVHSVAPEVFVHRDWPNRMLSTHEFNSFVRPFSDVDDTARLLRMDATAKTAVLKYDPGRPPGIYGSGDAGRFVNTHCPSLIRPERGDPSPFLEFLAMLVRPEDDRRELMRWVATLVSRPDVKMSYGVLMISETQGVGKGTLGERILAPLVGEWNVSYPSESEIVESGFNYWMSHTRLAVVHEIYAGHSAKAYNKLKSVITDKNITVNKKYVTPYSIENWLHVFACSNSMRAIQISSDDRRWFVPKVTEEKRTPEYWNELNRWLADDGGLAKIRYWSDEFVKRHGAVERSAAAPWSTQKAEVVMEGYSPGMVMVAGFLERVERMSSDQSWLEKNTRPEGANGDWQPRGAAVFDAALVRMIRDRIHEGRHSDRLEKPLTVRKVAKARGWHVHPEAAFLQDTNHARLLCQDRGLTELPLREALRQTRPLDAMQLAGEWMRL